MNYVQCKDNVFWSDKLAKNTEMMGFADFAKESDSHQVFLSIAYETNNNDELAVTATLTTERTNVVSCENVTDIFRKYKTASSIKKYLMPKIEKHSEKAKKYSEKLKQLTTEETETEKVLGEINSCNPSNDFSVIYFLFKQIMDDLVKQKFLKTLRVSKRKTFLKSALRDKRLTTSRINELSSFVYFTELDSNTDDTKPYANCKNKIIKALKEEITIDNPVLLKATLKSLKGESKELNDEFEKMGATYGVKKAQEIYFEDAMENDDVSSRLKSIDKEIRNYLKKNNSQFLLQLFFVGAVAEQDSVVLLLDNSKSVFEQVKTILYKEYKDAIDLNLVFGKNDEFVNFEMIDNFNNITPPKILVLKNSKGLQDELTKVIVATMNKPKRQKDKMIEKVYLNHSRKQRLTPLRQNIKSFSNDYTGLINALNFAR